MKKILLLIAAIFYTASLLAQNPSIPRLEKQENVTRLIVGDKPFLIRGAELHNSSTSSVHNMKSLWKEMKALHVNTVIAPVYWELFEPQEGKYDYTLIDSMIMGARQQKLHLVILWFASWKNGYSMYAPTWVKNNFEKYPRAKSKNGESFQMLSAFGEASARADARAFRMLMKHIKEVDSKEQTVVMVQIENEVGLFYSPRDYSKEATSAFNKSVPDDLLKYLVANKDKLRPEIDSVWKANGNKKEGTWETIFGKSVFDEKNWKTLSYLTEELFTVYHYAKYIGQVAREGKEEYGIPMYVNAWIKQPGGGWPGKYPSGGPTPHALDIWRAAAPSIDFISPDIYVPWKETKYTFEQYHSNGNPLFVPEYRQGLSTASEALWTYGEHDILGFAPFGIDDNYGDDHAISRVYAAVEKVQEVILANQGKKSIRGFLVDSTKRVEQLELNGYKISISLGGATIAEMTGLAPKRKESISGGIIMAMGPDEFIVIAKDCSLSFEPLNKNPETPLLDIDFMDEGYFESEKWITTRRLNGDEGTGGGDYGFGFGNNKIANLRLQRQPEENYSVIRFKIYKYR